LNKHKIIFDIILTKIFDKEVLEPVEYHNDFYKGTYEEDDDEDDEEDKINEEERQAKRMVTIIQNITGTDEQYSTFISKLDKKFFTELHLIAKEHSNWNMMSAILGASK